MFADLLAAEGQAGSSWHCLKQVGRPKSYVARVANMSCRVGDMSSMSLIRDMSHVSQHLLKTVHLIPSQPTSPRSVRPCHQCGRLLCLNSMYFGVVALFCVRPMSSLMSPDTNCLWAATNRRSPPPQQSASPKTDLDIAFLCLGNF
jgi:hypothetical protein